MKQGPDDLQKRTNKYLWNKELQSYVNIPERSGKENTSQIISQGLAEFNFKI